ncbi:MAG: hypothetical protein U9Q05_01160 [Thermodesulfobacteriota bacterium]|nr:hypothetical protein [Thermodesulfobacteriota bacterium]
MVRRDNIKKRFIVYSILIMTVIIFSGCSGSYGKLRGSSEITQTFLQKQMLPGYNYYYDGRKAIPYAVVGIRDDYVMTSKFWTPIKKDSSQFGRLLDWLYGSEIWDPRGAEILDPEGNPIGIWFSAYTYTRIEFGPENQVNVFSPYVPTRNSII